MHKTNLYSTSVPQMKKALTNLSAILDKAVLHANMKKGDIKHLLNDRLVFDQFPFVRQIQIACDNAKGTAARLAEVENPKMDDAESTIEELKARIDKTIAFLDTIRDDQIAGKEEVKVPIYFMPGKYLDGFEYVFDYALPNFYFHMTTAYSILRKNGVTLGKGDYIGTLNLKDL